MYRLLPAVALVGCSLLPERIVEVPVMASCELPERLMAPVPEEARPRFDYLQCGSDMRWALRPGHLEKYINLLRRDKAWREAGQTLSAPLDLKPLEEL